MFGNLHCPLGWSLPAPFYVPITWWRIHLWVSGSWQLGGEWSFWNWLLFAPLCFYLFIYFTLLLLFLIFIYLFGCAGSQSRHAGSLVAACGILVVARMWGLVAWPGMEPGPPALGARSLTTGPPGKSLAPLSAGHHQLLGILSRIHAFFTSTNIYWAQCPSDWTQEMKALSVWSSRDF